MFEFVICLLVLIALGFIPVHPGMDTFPWRLFLGLVEFE